MKTIGGKLVRLTPRTVEVVIGHGEDGQPVTLTLRAPRMGMFERLGRDLPEPEAPAKGVQKNGRGEPLRDPDTGKPKVIRDVEDAAYLAALAERNRMVLACALAECAVGVEPETKRSDHGDHVSYARALLAEWEATGIDHGAWGALDRAMLSLLGPVAAGEAQEARAALGVTGPG